MATYTKTVDPNGSADYASLSLWEAGEQALYSSGDIAIADCKRTGATKDMTAVAINGWNAGVIPKIIVNSAYSHEGKWADTRASDGNYIYSLEVGNSIAILAQVNGTVVSALKLANNATSDYRYIVSYANVGGTIKGCLITSLGGVGIARSGINAVLLTTQTVTIYDNICFSLPGIGVNCSAVDSGSAFIYNNTVYGCTGGFQVSYLDGIAINNYAGNCSSYCYSADAFFTGTNNNVSSDGTANGTTVAINKTAYTDYFVDPANGDFHLKNTSQNLWGIASANLTSTFTTDIDGQTRANSDQFGISADYYVAAGGSWPHPTRTFNGPFYGPLRGSVL